MYKAYTCSTASFIRCEHGFCILSPNMASNLKYIPQYTEDLKKRGFAEELTALMALDAPSGRFLMEMLKVQCRATGADGGVLVRFNSQDQLDILAVYPPSRTKTATARAMRRGVVSARSWAPRDSRRS